MQALNNYRIEWRYIHPSTFMYGTTLQFKKKVRCLKSAYAFRNSDSCLAYAHADIDKAVPSLPILRKGYHYEIKLNFDVQPPRAAYVKVTFYRKMILNCRI